MKIVICFVILLSLSACSSGTCVDDRFKCKNGKPAGVMINPNNLNGVAKSSCLTQQKIYTGTWRCEGDDLQVKCE